MIRNKKAFERNLPPGFDGVFDWSFLDGTLGRASVSPTDFDCVLEHGGFFLVFETKMPGVEISAGQRSALEAFVRRGYGIVLIVNGKSSTTITRVIRLFPDPQAIYPHKVGLENSNAVRPDGLPRFCSAWWRAASAPDDEKRQKEIEKVTLRAYCL